MDEDQIVQLEYLSLLLACLLWTKRIHNMAKRSEKQRDVNRNEKIQEFLKLMSLNQSQIYGYTFSLVPHKADADDLMQEIKLNVVLIEVCVQ